jgi:hypothetical protein
MKFALGIFFVLQFVLFNSFVESTRIYPNINLATSNSGIFIYGLPEDSYTGNIVNAAGDFNGDGWDDFLVSATGTGCYLVFGKDFPDNINLNLFETTNQAILFADDEGQYDCNGIGDINGDQFPDIAISIPAAEGSQIDLFFGNMLDVEYSTALLYTSQHYSEVLLSRGGDINQDGIDDLFIGGYLPNSPFIAYLIYGRIDFPKNLNLDSLNSGDGILLYASMTLTGDFYSFSISTANDFNGDGYDDLLIGAPNMNNIAGIVYIIYGGIHLPETINLHTLTSYQGLIIDGYTENDLFGCSVSTAGDINGDGIADILIGAYGVNQQAGAAYIVYGSNSYKLSDMDRVSITELMGVGIYGRIDSSLGYSVAGGYDIDQDGYDDILVGAPHNNDQVGTVYVIFGSHDRMGSIDLMKPHLFANNIIAYDGIDSTISETGYAVSFIGDINQDGFADFVIGSPLLHSNQGAAYAILGSETMFSASLSDISNVHFIQINEGERVIAMIPGDINNDSYIDLLISGFPSTDVYLIYGSNHTFRTVTSMDELMSGEGMVIHAESDIFSFQTAGDFNHDGMTDMIFSLSNSAFIIFGKDTTTTTTTAAASSSSTVATTEESVEGVVKKKLYHYIYYRLINAMMSVPIFMLLGNMYQDIWEI